jgi:hypothetical protein
MINVAKTFDKHFPEYLKFENIDPALCPSRRPDLCAFIRLDKMFPAEHYEDIICGTNHDEIFLNVSVDSFKNVATDEDVLYLVRCGVRFVRDDDRFAIFI